MESEVPKVFEIERWVGHFGWVLVVRTW
jgi:hypothetical protein